MNHYSSNYDRFSSNIFKPETVTVNDQFYQLYSARFHNLYNLYQYLKSDPTINQAVFFELRSETKQFSFSGKPYKEAVEDLIKDYDPGYQEFLKLQKQLNFGKNKTVHKYETIRTVAGGHLNIPAYSAGSPLCYETERSIVHPKFVRIHVSLSYRWDTSKSQVLHRAIIMTNILKALENAGYNVLLDTFLLAQEENELVYIVTQLKKHSGRLDMGGLYKVLYPVEFLRRILFRVIETLDVKQEWCNGYGSTCDEDFARCLLKCGINDIFFDQPISMKIDGIDLAEDFQSAIEHLHLSDKIDVDKAIHEFQEQSKKLELKYLK